MTKKDYQKPEIKDMGILEESELLAYSVKSSGLGDDDLELDGTGDAWGDAMSRSHNAWGDDEEW